MFYLAVDSDELHLLVGNFALNLTESELSQYQRTLYGAHAAYRSTPTSSGDDPRTSLDLFASQGNHAHVRTELRATGGPLYYLRHQDIVEGSEHVTLVVRDKQPGIVVERRPQRRNTDYTVKYPEGRLWFSYPVASVEGSSTLVGTEVLEWKPRFDPDRVRDALGRSRCVRVGRARPADRRRWRDAGRHVHEG